MSLIVALAWNAAFKNIFDNILFFKKYGPWIYAVIVTIVLILFVKLMVELLNTITQVKINNIIKQQEKIILEN